MAYVRYEVDVTPRVYSDYEGLRKEYLGKRLSRKEAETLIGLCGLPSESPKVGRQGVQGATHVTAGDYAEQQH